MSNVVQLFASSGEDEVDEYVPSFPVSDEAATMRERVNRIYSRHLVERGFSKGELDGDGLTASERGGHAKAAAYRDGWSADDQAIVDAWLESDPWASRLAAKLDELAGKDSGATTSPREADSGKRLITDPPSDKCDASSHWATPPARGPKKAGAVPTREGGTAAPPSSSSRVGDLTARDPPRRFLAPVEGPAEVVESISVVAPVVPSERRAAGATTAGEPKQETEASMGLTEKQRAIADAYNAGKGRHEIAAAVGSTANCVDSVVSKLRKKSGIITRPKAGFRSEKLVKSPAVTITAKTVGKAILGAELGPKTSISVRAGQDPILDALRVRRAELVAAHEAKLAGIDAAIKALGGAV